MKKVTGIGGVFFKVKDTEASKVWYEKHLGISMNQWGGQFVWRDHENPDEECITAWNPFAQDNDYFQPSSADFMINYRVADLEGLLKELKKQGVEQIGEMQTFDYGKFAWIMDPNGIKIELWEPKDKVLLNM